MLIILVEVNPLKIKAYIYFRGSGVCVTRDGYILQKKGKALEIRLSIRAKNKIFLRIYLSKEV